MSDRSAVQAHPFSRARDPWAWLCLLAPLPLFLRSLGAPFGEPVADDYDFLHHALFRPGSWLDGGGGLFYWRPLARQAWYGVAGGAMLTHPAAVALVQALMMSLAALLLYRALRVRWPAPWAAFAASFPFLMESARQLFATPTNMQDLGAVLCVAAALHEASRGRLPTALVALAASLLCKEMAVVAAPLLAWFAPMRARSGRIQWTAAALAVVAAWGALYAVAAKRAGLLFARDLVSDPAVLGTPWPARYTWSLAQSAGDALGVSGLPDAVRPAAVAAALGLLALSAGVLVRSARARSRLLCHWPWAAGGLAWFLGATALLADVHPEWRSYRSTFGLMGLGVACGVVLGSAHGGLLATLTALKLATLAVSTAPPATVGVLPEARAASVTYPELVRTQRFARLTRRALLEAHPSVPRGSRFGRHLIPRVAMYGFAGDRALHVWYRDTTLRWLPFGDFLADTAATPVTIVEYQQVAARQVALVSPDAMRALLRGAGRITRLEWPAALDDLDRADSLQGDRGAGAFLGIVADRRSLALAALGENARAEREARAAIRLWPEATEARYVLARLWAGAGRFDAAVAQLDTLLAISPTDSGASRLRRQIHEVASGRLGVAANPRE